MGAKASISLFLVILLALSASAASYFYNSKEYFVVTSTDPAMDTGNEVCQAAGKICVGYTAYTTDVCKYFNPTATVSSNLNGDKSGVYCDGAPQTSECSTRTNDCHICPECTVGVTCSEPIGGLYREMYVECQSCGKITASTTKEFLAGLDYDFSSCAKDLPGAVSLMVSNGNVQINVKMNDGTTETFYAVIKSKKLLGFKRIAAPYSYIVNTDENTVDSILQATSSFNAAANAFKQKQLILQGATLLSRIKLFVAKPIASLALRNVPAAPVSGGNALNPQQQQQATIGPYPNMYACEFFQIPWPGTNKKYVTCPYETPNAAFNQAADAFCQTAMGSAKARAAACDATGLIVCTHPCPTSQFEIMPQRCAYDLNRLRGNQAAPLSWCTAVPKPAVNSGTGRPSNCFETAYQGHQGYQYAKALWDQYASETDGVAQCQNSELPKGGNCKYTVQQSVGGIPYYICFYKNT